MDLIWELQRSGPDVRAKALVILEVAIGVGGFTYMCVAASCCGSCYVDPCVHPAGLKMLYKVNSSLCFAGITTGMFLCFLAGWGCLLTLRRRASVMGFGHFFGATCVTFLVMVQSAGMWGAEATLLQEFTNKRIYEYAIIEGLYKQVRVKQNRALHRSSRFLFTLSIIFALTLMVLAPLYFISRDVYEDGEDDRMMMSEGGHAARPPPEGLRTSRGPPTTASSAGGSRSLYISAYEPISGETAPATQTERQYLGRANLPMRPIRPQFKSGPFEDENDGV